MLPAQGRGLLVAHDGGSGRIDLDLEEVGLVNLRAVAEGERDQQQRDAQCRWVFDVLLESPLQGVVVLKPAERVVHHGGCSNDVEVVADVVL